MAARAPINFVYIGNYRGPGETLFHEYRPPKDCYAFLVECIGGGGGGGDALASTAGNASCGSGGSGGAYAYGMYLAPFKRQSYRYQIGAKGKGGFTAPATMTGFNLYEEIPVPWVVGQINAGSGVSGGLPMKSGNTPAVTIAPTVTGGVSYQPDPNAEFPDGRPQMEARAWDRLATLGGACGGPGQPGVRLDGNTVIGGSGGANALFAGAGVPKTKNEMYEHFWSLIGDGNNAHYGDYGCGGSGAITYGTPNPAGDYGINLGLTTRNAKYHEYHWVPELIGQPVRDHEGRTFLEAYPNYRLDYMPDCLGGEGTGGLIRITEYFQFHDHWSRLW
jgi:hypothetical protein